MSAYEQRVRDAINATSFHWPGNYSWFGRMGPRLPQRVRKSLTLKSARAYLLYNLQSQLYGDFYLCGYASPMRWETVGSVANRTLFIDALSAANAGNGYWEAGWTIRALTPDKIVVHKGGLELTVAPEDPGFYMASGDRELRHDGSRPLIRLYWNLTSGGAARFVRVTTSVFNVAGLPFRLKVLDDPSRFTRCDAAVVYLCRDDFAGATGSVKRVHTDVGGYLKPLTPVFTRTLAPGLGFAEDPGEEESFGQHRCRLLADAMVRGYERGAASIAERLQVAIERFTEDGISLEEPYLNRGSIYAGFRVPW